MILKKAVTSPCLQISASFLQHHPVLMELISWKPTTLTYAATSIWYAFDGCETNLKPQPKEANLPIPTLAQARAEAEALRPRKPGAIEIEKLKIIRKSGNFEAFIQDMEPWGQERWSRGEQVTAKATRPGDFIEIEVPMPDGKAREIILHPTLAPDYGILSFQINGKPSKATFDGYGPKVEPGQPVKLGIFAAENGKLLLRVEVTGANPKSAGARYYFGLDCITFE